MDRPRCRRTTGRLAQAGDGEAGLEWKGGASVTPQKAADCGIEAPFSWLANVLCKPDYKLVKAYMLQAYPADAASMGVESTFSNRLNQRLTSSLRGCLDHLDRPVVESGE